MEADFTPDSGNELATFVAREDTSQRGRIDVYNNAGGIVGTIDIDDVVNMYCADVTVPDFSSPKRNLLIVETEYDENVGAYTKTRVSTVYLYDGNNFISVWSGPVEVESSWNLKWNKDGRSSESVHGRGLGEAFRGEQYIVFLPDRRGQIGNSSYEGELPSRISEIRSGM